MKELWKATHPEVPGGGSLHIINRETDLQPWVVCYNYNGTDWDHGTYCDTIERATEIFLEKLAAYGYLPKGINVRIPYHNGDRKCECHKCELDYDQCPVRDKYQRHPADLAPGALGACPKL